MGEAGVVGLTALEKIALGAAFVTVPTAFLITPLSAKTAGEEDPEVYERIQFLIREGASAAGVAIRTAEDIFASGVIIEQIRAAIEEADLVLGVCTGRNPNVFYELGLAEVLGHKPILIAASPDDLPFDLKHWRAHLYGEEIDDLAERVSKAMKETLAERKTARRRPRRPRTPTRTPPVAAEKTQLEAPPQVELGPIGTPEVRFAMEAKTLILAALDELGRFAEANHEAQPSDVGEALTSIRNDATERVVSFLAPVIEYQPRFLDESVLRLFGEVFSMQSRPDLSGFLAWQQIQRG